jgi:hypothetical protein
VDAHLSEIRGFITKRLENLQMLISGEPAEARKELLKHVSEIRMFPQSGGDGNGKSHYVAEGTWHLIGNAEDETDAIPVQVRSVADPRNQIFLQFAGFRYRKSFLLLDCGSAARQPSIRPRAACIEPGRPAIKKKQCHPVRGGIGEI